MKKSAAQRPDITTIKKALELRRWYWLKTELAAEARRLGLKCSGAKFTILERLCHFHTTGEVVWPGDRSAKTRVVSNFDWHSSVLTEQTVITDSYKNTQNVRRFFQAHVDPKFKFNIAFMAWLKSNVGKTLGEAGRFWQAQQANPTKTTIKPHNQFNQYARDFMAANPELGMKDARAVWARKRKLPSETGRHTYEPTDLELRD